jgi:hypothetical protein
LAYIHANFSFLSHFITKFYTEKHSIPHRLQRVNLGTAGRYKLDYMTELNIQISDVIITRLAFRATVVRAQNRPGELSAPLIMRLCGSHNGLHAVLPANKDSLQYIILISFSIASKSITEYAGDSN